jgi:hypothetical protein
MLEMMVGGAMAAVVLVGMMSFISSGRVQNIAAGRTITANHIVNELLEQTRSGAYPPVASGPTVITAAGGKYTRTATVDATDCPEVRTNPGGGTAFSMACTNVNVTVTFSITDGGTTKLHTSTATMRMYP